MNNILKKIYVLPIRFYKKFISPMLGNNCRYNPTCSQYALHAIEEWGILKGTYLGIKRIMSCHPWGGSGYDPVPKKEINKNESKTEKK